MKILLVDDEESLLNLVKINLMFENYEVITAECGKTAIELFQTQSPDLVVLDLMLPDIDGFQVIHAIQEINNEIPIIVLSAKNQINDRLLGLQLGADDYVTKPFDSRELILRIRAISRRINKAKLLSNKKQRDRKSTRLNSSHANISYA